jgi:polygalacturonase
MHLNASADGVADDSAAVQRAVRLAVGACGGRVFFPSGAL